MTMAKAKELIQSVYKKATVFTHLDKSLSQMGYKALCLIVFHVNAGGKKIGRKYYLRKKFVRQLTLGWKAGTTDTFYKGLEELYANEIIWNFLEKDYAFKKERKRLLIDLSEPSDKGHYYAFSLHPELEEYIKHPKIYGQQRIIMMAILTKPKSCFRLYDLLIDAYSRKEVPFKIQLKDLIRELGFEDKTSYNRWIDFKKYVLSPNLKAINKKSDLKISFKTFKNGRKIAGCIFEIKKQQWQMPFNEMLLKEIQLSYIKEEQIDIVLVGQPITEQQTQKFIQETYKKYGVSKEAIQGAIEVFGLEKAIEIKDYALSMHSKDNKSNLSAYMGRCFREGYGIIKPIEERKKEKTIQKQQENEFQKKEIQELESLYREAHRRKINEIVENFSEVQKIEEEKEFAEYMKSKSVFDYQRYQKKGLTGVQVDYRIFIDNRHLDKTENNFILWAKKYHKKSIIRNSQSGEYELKNES